MKKTRILAALGAGELIESSRSAEKNTSLSKKFDFAYKLSQFAFVGMIALAALKLYQAAFGSISFTDEWGQFVAPIFAAGFFKMISSLCNIVSENLAGEGGGNV